MRHRSAALAGLASVGALALVGGIVSPARADIAPQAGDIVVVGSDTVQAAGNFLADGSPYGDAGYNSPSPKNRVFNFDATADANTRLAYGTGGANTGGGQCAPGTGGATGTGNDNATHTETGPCLLNPTSVLRAGQSPVQRPNGSGGGQNAILNDTVQPYKINVGRSSSAISSTNFTAATTAFSDGGFVSIKIGTDPLGILSSSNTHAVALSAAQLNQIYACSAAFDNWTDAGVGGTVAGTILPIIPQVGSGTRNAFLGATASGGIGSPTLGGCVKVAEENDPEAIDASGDAINAIEPMSQSRLLLFKGLLSDGSNGGVGPYFLDPSCPAYRAISTATLPSKTCAAAGNPLNPNVFFWNPGGSTSGGANGTLSSSGYASVPATVPATASDTNPTYVFVRPLYLYLRNADRNIATPFQPGTTKNWVRTLFYNPCDPGASGCVTIGGIQYGSGGAPYVAGAAGKAAISAAGIVPAYSTAVGTNAP